MKTLIKEGVVVAYINNKHQILKNAAILIDGKNIADILFDKVPENLVVDQEIDAAGMLVSPGFVNIHTHGTIQALGIYTLDWARRDLFGYNYLATQTYGGANPSLSREEAEILSLNFLVKVLKTGSTTVLEMGAVGTSADSFAQMAGEIGIRAYTTIGFRSANYSFDNHGILNYIWDEEQGNRDFEAALKHFNKYHDSYGGRLQGYIEPRNADTCTPELLKKSIATARDYGVPLQIHTAQSLFEFHSIVRRTGKTPVQFLNDLGVLGRSTILGHCVFTTGHSKVAWPGDEDQIIMADTGTSIGHSPTIFMRDGFAFESFSRHRRLGVNIAIGTDVFPEDIIREMGVVSKMSKLVENDFEAGTAWEVFDAATLGGARALNRNDLGRIEKGAKADIVLIDLNNILIGPYDDPIKTLVHTATGRDVDTVIVNGNIVVKNKEILSMDINEKELLSKAQVITERVWGESMWPYKEDCCRK